MRKYSYNLLIGAIFLATGVFAGENDHTEVEVELGLGGCYRKECWFPIIIKVAPRVDLSRSFRAVATLEAAERCDKPAQPLRSFSRRFRFDKEKENQKFLLPTRTSPAADRIRLVLSDEATGRPFFARNFPLKPTRRNTVLILSTQPSVFDILSSLKAEAKTVVIPPGELPESGHLYDSFNLMIIDDITLGAITPAAWEAILDWAAGGRELIFTENCLKTNFSYPAFQELWLAEKTPDYTVKKPATFIRFLQLKDASLGPISGTGVALPEKNIFLKESGYPIMGINNIGLGTMFLLTFSPDNLKVIPPEKDYQVRQQIWAWLSTVDAGKDRLKWDWEYTAPETAKTSHLKKYILAYLVAVILIILGPLNLLLLKRFDRREYLLVIIPLVVILLGVAPYLLGRKLRGDRTKLKMMSAGLGRGGEVRGIGRTYLGLLASDTREYRLEIEENNSWPIDFIETGYRHMESAKVGRFPIATDFQREEILVSNLEIPLWSMRFFRLDDFHRYAGPLEYEIGLKEGFLEGTLTNNLGFDLKDAYLILRYQRASLGEIKNGETVSWTIPTLDRSAPCPERTCPFSKRLWHEEPISDNERAFFHDVIKHFTWQFESPLLLARATDSLTGLAINRPDWVEEEEKFVFFSLPLHLETLDIPFGLSQRMNFSHGLLRVGKERPAVVRYDLPFHINEPVITEELYLRFKRMPEKTQPLIKFEAYCWADDTWETVGSTSEEEIILDFPDPERFVLFPGGWIRIRLSQGDSQGSEGCRIEGFGDLFEGCMPGMGTASVQCLDIAYRGRRMDE